MFDVPGCDLLDLAFTVINSQTVMYYQYADRTLNSIGQYVATYSDPFPLEGSFQPVPRNLYSQYGLDFQKEYWTFYASLEILDVSRDVSGDQLTFGGSLYQVLSDNDWYKIDGWGGVLCVRVGPDNLAKKNVR